MGNTNLDIQNRKKMFIPELYVEPKKPVENQSISSDQPKPKRKNKPGAGPPRRLPEPGTRVSFYIPESKKTLVTQLVKSLIKIWIEEGKQNATTTTKAKDVSKGIAENQ